MVGRKVLLTVIIVLLSNSFLSAQDALKQGVYYLSGSVSFNSSRNKMKLGLNETEQTKSINFSIQPTFSYFLIDQLSIGGDITFMYSELDDSYPSGSFKLIFRDYGIGPNLRYYFTGSSLVPFVSLSAAYSKTGSGHYREGNTLSLSAGMDYFISNSAALEPFISYVRSSYKNYYNVNAFYIGIRTNYFIVN